jgi:hypothetical protein
MRASLRRAALGAFAKGISSFRVNKEEDRRVVLEPFVEILMRLLNPSGNAKEI